MVGKPIIAKARAWCRGTTDDGSAFSLAASLLKGKVSINLAGNPLDNSVSISTGDFNAVLSALSSDSRFKVVSQPSLRVRSGKEATINVGAEVPEIGRAHV